MLTPYICITIASIGILPAIKRSANTLSLVISIKPLEEQWKTVRDTARPRRGKGGSRLAYADAVSITKQGRRNQYLCDVIDWPEWPSVHRVDPVI